MRPGAGVHGPGLHYRAGDEFVVSFAEAAQFLKGKGRRCVEIVEVIDDPPDATRG